MATSGYSGTPLLKKLGIKPTMKLMLINQPSKYYDWLEVNLNDQLCKKNETPDFIHVFVQYKKAAKIETDITEDVIRDYALQNDLVDVKVCAVSEQWSGLKLVVPLAKR